MSKRTKEVIQQYDLLRLQLPGQELPADFMVGIRGEPEQCGHWWEQGASEALEKTGKHF